MGGQAQLYTQLPIGSPARNKLKATLSPRTTHGGAESRGHRKTARPYAAKAPVHLVLQSARARGEWSMLKRKHRARVQAMIYTYAKRFKVHVYRATNVGNHLHLLVKAPERKALADYLRVLAGRVAVTVTGAKRGVKKIGKFWDSLCWSRIVNFGRDFYNVRDYLAKNFELDVLKSATCDPSLASNVPPDDPVFALLRRDGDRLVPG